MKNFIRAFIISVIVIIILKVLTDDYEKPKTIINDSNTYQTEWRMPKGTEYVEIGKLIVKHNIKICGEYQVKEITPYEYVIACSTDGINWEYFVAYTKIDKFYRANDEMVSKLKPPR